MFGSLNKNLKDGSVCAVVCSLLPCLLSVRKSKQHEFGFEISEALLWHYLLRYLGISWQNVIKEKNY